MVEERPDPVAGAEQDDAAVDLELADDGHSVDRGEQAADTPENHGGRRKLGAVPDGVPPREHPDTRVRAAGVVTRAQRGDGSVGVTDERRHAAAPTLVLRPVNAHAAMRRPHLVENRRRCADTVRPPLLEPIGRDFLLRRRHAATLQFATLPGALPLEQRAHVVRGA